MKYCLFIDFSGCYSAHNNLPGVRICQQRAAVFMNGIIVFFWGGGINSIYIADFVKILWRIKLIKRKRQPTVCCVFSIFLSFWHLSDHTDNMLQIVLGLAEEHRVSVCIGDLLWLSWTMGHLDALLCFLKKKRITIQFSLGQFAFYSANLKREGITCAGWQHSLHEERPRFLWFEVSAADISIHVVCCCSFMSPSMHPFTSSLGE